MGNLRMAVANKIPVVSSTMEVMESILFLQYLHFPFKSMKENRGTRSRKESLLLQLSQYDLPNKLSFLGNL